MKTRIVRYHETGGPEVLRIESEVPPAPGPGQLLIRNTVIGMNMMDTNMRAGMYPSQLPATLGNDSVGVVENVGEGVTELKPGDRVHCSGNAKNAYGDYRIGSIEKTIPLPDGISDLDAAALLQRGMSAQYLVKQVTEVNAGDPVLFLAAAGGVGAIACQWLKLLGAYVIGTVSSEAKADVARECGCDEIIVTSEADFSDRVRELVPDGVAIAYDGVGKDTFAASLDCLRPRGMLINFGASSGKVPPFDVIQLALKGSIYLSRPALASFITNREELMVAANEVMDLFMTGAIRLSGPTIYDLQDVQKAHSDVAERRTIGQLVFTT